LKILNKNKNFTAQISENRRNSERINEKSGFFSSKIHKKVQA